MSPEREKELKELIDFVGIWATLKGVDPDSPVHPANAVKEIISRFGRSKALVGSRQAANDVIEMTSGWTPEQIAIFDSHLSEAGLITLADFKMRYSSAYKRILKKGLIKNETEYYLINGVLVDLAANISDAERANLQRMIAAFEGQLATEIGRLS